MTKRITDDFEATTLAAVGMLVAFIVVVVSFSFIIPGKRDGGSRETELPYYGITMGGFRGVAGEEPEPCALFFDGVVLYGTPDGGVYFNAYDWARRTFCEVPVVNEGF